MSSPLERGSRRALAEAASIEAASEGPEVERAPAVDLEPDRDDAPTTKTSDPPPGSSTDATARILVVEDNVINQKVARHMLERLGFEVDVADDGRVALEMIEHHDYRLVLMDIQMPTMDGLQATAELRRRERDTGHHLPVAALTAHTMEEDRTRCLEVGMDEFLSKPLRPGDLRRVLREHGLELAAADPA